MCYGFSSTLFCREDFVSLIVSVTAMMTMCLPCAEGNDQQDMNMFRSTVDSDSCFKAAEDDTSSQVSTELGNDATGTSQRLHDGADDLAWPAYCQNLIIFDWDDTLFPTTWLHQQGLLKEDAEVSEEQGVQLQALASLVATTLDAAKRRSAVSIVTNAEHGWVELSCRTFMPTLQAHLLDINIVSARTRHEQHGLVAPTTWKCLAFEEVVGEFFSVPDGAGVAARRNIISIGDSEHEMDALKWVANGTECYAKSVKFVQKPCVEQLMEQHELVARSVDDVVDHGGNLDCEVGLEDI